MGKQIKKIRFLKRVLCDMRRLSKSLNAYVPQEKKKEKLVSTPKAFSFPIGYLFRYKVHK